MKKNVALLLLLTANSVFAMTEYEVLSTKHHFVQSLKTYIYDAALFKKQFHEYAIFLHHLEQRDNGCINVLDAHFKQSIDQDHKSLKQAHHDLQVWQDTIKKAYFLKNMDKASVVIGLASGALALSMGYAIYSIFKNSTELTDADGVVASVPAIIGIGSGIMSLHLVREGWNHTQPLQDTVKVFNKRLAVLNENYQYMLHNKDSIGLSHLRY